jgi:hypothetical protein
MAPPPNNVIYNNVHNTVVINNVTNTVAITNPSGQTQTVPPSVAMAPAPQPAAVSTQGVSPHAVPQPRLPPSVAQKAATLQTQSPQRSGAQPSASGSSATQSPPQAGQPLPGMKGQPLPPATGSSVTPTPSEVPSPQRRHSGCGTSQRDARPRVSRSMPPFVASPPCPTLALSLAMH